MNYYFFGLHGTGKSTSIVRVIAKINPKKVYLLAADPFQKDTRTGQYVFPEHWERTDESILEDHRKADRIGACVVVDDATIVRRKWKLFETLLATPRQSACDFFMTFHGFDLCPPQLFVYCNTAVCFRTASYVPHSANWGEKKNMKWCLDYIKEFGNEHACYIINNATGKIRICKSGL